MRTRKLSVSAALWLLILGALFFSSYNAANWLTSQRSYVPSVVYSWESRIPFWPWTIVPYWSIDLFYGISLFICTTRREFDTHIRRLLAVQLISITCFLLLPLRCILIRPETTGLFGAMLHALLVFDKPFNQAPSLHISLLVILWVRYLAHLNGAWRWVLNVWFILIGISVLTTYQHHFFDIPTGLWVGWLCVSGSLLLVSLIYACLDAGAFQKSAEGRLSRASQWLLAPYLIAAGLNSRWWTRHQHAADAITPEVWIGRLPGNSSDLPPGVKVAFDFCAELPCPALPVSYVRTPTIDLILLSSEQLESAATTIARAIVEGPVLVCCALGYSRSAAAVAAWLMRSGHAATAREAVALISCMRPQVVLHDAQRLALDTLRERA